MYARISANIGTWIIIIHVWYVTILHITSYIIIVFTNKESGNSIVPFLVIIVGEVLRLIG